MNYLDMWGNSSLYNPKIGIQKIRLSNFKSIERSDSPIEIELSPLTLLCGENSSGKSTLLHSILLLLQSLNAEKITGSTFPLNGKLIQLNELASILNASGDDFIEYSLKELAGERKKDFELKMGIDFNSPLVKSSKEYEQTDTTVKFDITLSPEFDFDERSDFRGFKPFPNNSETMIEVLGTRTSLSNNDGEQFATRETKETLKFSRIDVNKKVNIFRINNGAAEVKKHTNYRWTCEYEEYKMDTDSFVKNWDDRFGGVEFISGLPSKVFNREVISDYLSRKMTEQLRTLLEDKDFLMDTFFWWEDSKFLEKENKTSAGPWDWKIEGSGRYDSDQIHSELISFFADLFTSTRGEEMVNALVKNKGVDFKKDLPEEAFCLWWNTQPFIGSDYKDFYINNTQLAIDLIDLVNRNPKYEYEEMLGGIFWNLGPKVCQRGH